MVQKPSSENDSIFATWLEPVYLKRTKPPIMGIVLPANSAASVPYGILTPSALAPLIHEQSIDCKEARRINVRIVYQLKDKNYFFSRKAYTVEAVASTPRILCHTAVSPKKK